MRVLSYEKKVYVSPLHVAFNVQAAPARDTCEDVPPLLGAKFNIGNKDGVYGTKSHKDLIKEEMIVGYQGVSLLVTTTIQNT